MGRKPAVCTMGGAIIRRFALFPLMLLMLLLLPAGMVAQKAASSSKYIATYESSTNTLTFKKNVGETLPENSAWVEDKQTVATINKNLGNGTIVHIVFDKSFSTYTPTSLREFFRNLTNLETITGLEYLNTANVTNMRNMFSLCSSLTSLDVTHFNTANVKKMNGMFSYSVALTSLYLTNFNTEKVTNMEDMFSGCQALTTIYASSKFVTTQVTKSSGMFNKCEKLKGEEEWKNDKATDKTYAKIEGGYFSRAIPRVKYADGTLTFFLASKETLGENEYELNSGKNLPEWVKHTFSITKVVFDTSFANARPTSCYKWFFWCEKLNQVEGIKNLNTKEVTDMADMFYECRDLSSLDVSGFNTEKVTDMSGMFYECISLKLLDVAKFNTANVKSMSNMFYRCYNLDLLNVTNFNTANVTNMQGMFYSCPALTTIYASDKFVTDQVTESTCMFSDCLSFKDYTSSKEDHTYANCGPTGYFTYGRGYAMFDNATGTLTFSYKGFKPEGAYDLNEGANTPAWNDQSAKINKVVFDASFANAKPTSCYKWFCGCGNLAQIEGIEYLNTEEITNMAWMFKGCSNLKSLDVSKFNTAQVTDMSYMFTHCWGLESLDVSRLNTENVTNMENMFLYCSNSKLTSLDVSNFNTEKVTNMSCMFRGNSNLTSLDLSNFNTQDVKDMSYMLMDCRGLTSLDLSGFNTPNVENMSGMFNGCYDLTTIYVSDKFVTTKVSDGTDMFYGCTSLKGAIKYEDSSYGYPEYSEGKTDHTYANYKTGYFTKLVGKNGNDKIGAVGEVLTAESLALADDKDFEAYEPFTAKTATYTRTLKEGTSWATLCLPFEVSLADQNFRAFKLLSADETTNTVELKEIETSIAAGTPVIIKMKEGQTALNFSVANKEIANNVKTAATADGSYQLQGLYTKKVFDKVADNNCYIVKGDKLMNPTKLLEYTSTTQVGSKPFRAYMVDNTSSSAGAKMFGIAIGDSTTAIDSLNTIADDKAVYYDLQGNRLSAPQKGINIVKRGSKTMKVIIK